MPLRQTIFHPGSYYHIYNRGSEKRTIFLDHQDYTKFLVKIKENAQKYAIDVLCYCLLSNHFHLLLKQASEISIAIFMNTLQLAHSKYFNTKYKRVGPLFQGRFKAKPIETDEYLLWVSSYIHKNPITHLSKSMDYTRKRDIIRQELHDYPYSSYQEYIHASPITVTKPDYILSYFSKTKPDFSYQAFVEDFIPDYDQLAPLLLDI